MAYKTTRQLIIEIVLRAVGTTMPTAPPADIDALTEEVTNLVEAVLVGVKEKATVATTSLSTFVSMNTLLDKIEQEMPAIEGKIGVTGMMGRAEWKELMNYGTAKVSNADKPSA